MTGISSPTKPTTRSSIRQSLTGLAGKAFADVMNKDSDKSARKAKDASTRRNSGIYNKSSGIPRTSLGGDMKSPPATVTHRGPSTLDTNKTVTQRRRISNTSSRLSEDQSSAANVSEFGGLPSAKATTLRPKTGTTSSNLPKYKPKAGIVENGKQSSPKTGSRRPLINSEDETEENRPISAASSSSVSKGSRPISPLPHRAALKNLSSAVNITPPATPTQAKHLSASGGKQSPRPSKLVKTAATGSGVASAIPRPPSSTSSNSFTPHTPRTHGASVTRKGVQDNSRASPTPSKPTTSSPISRHTRQRSKETNVPPPQAPVGNMSLIHEADSEEDEADDVALLLAPVASIEAPTPAMPKMQPRRTTHRPRTESLSGSRNRRSRKSSMHTRAQTYGGSPRPSPKGENKAGRGSIMSWEQLANECSITLGEGEVDNMLADVDAPFNTSLLSPTPSNAALEIPESPCLSALSSPGGYGSISQVLLPEVTPSPAAHRELAHFELAASTPTGDSGTVNLLRLQLAAMENTAKERLYQMQKMEEEIHNLKKARNRDAHDLMNQVAYMEEQMRGSLEIRERAEEERQNYICDLQQQLHEAREDRDQAVLTAEAVGQETARAALGGALRAQEAIYQTASIASSASMKWQLVSTVSQMELDHVRSDMEVLSALLCQLDQMRYHAL